MDWSDFSGKSVALLGAGTENISLISHLKKAGATVTVCDRSDELEELDSDIRLVTGEHYLSDIAGYDFLFRSPGLPTAVVEQALINAQSRPELTSAVDLIFSMKGQQVIAVTGTKGKGTTSSMITQILKAAGKPVILAGNIGNSIFDSWDRLTPETLIVMEVSSFQLEDVAHSPHIAVVLPITADHLQPLSERSPNFHQDLPSYIVAKQQITAYQGPDDTVVFSLDSQASAQIGQSAAAKKISVSAKTKADVFVEGGVLRISQTEIDLAKETKLRGDHLFHNAAVACAVADILKISVENMLEGLSSFRPLPHRMEEVGVFGGVKYVDDSYATAPDATIAALSAYTDQPTILILGGSSKGADFSELAQRIESSSVKTVVLVGQEAVNIEQSLKKFAPKISRLTGFSVFKDAVETALRQANSGDVVLLSPACASKDMFKNAAERGEKFTKLIHELS
ncbi:MAG: UDP-N-acetylmuramoyl-L-alanine--D-glutamate ligase [Patescibacteria group bacterium]